MPGVQRASDLRGAHACFSRVGSLVSWTIPVYSLIKNDVMEIKDCNNHVKSAIDFFGTSCAVNSLQGDKSHGKHVNKNITWETRGQKYHVEKISRGQKYLVDS